MPFLQVLSTQKDDGKATWQTRAMHNSPDAALALRGHARARRALQREKKCHGRRGWRGPRHVEVGEGRVEGKSAYIRGVVVDELGHLHKKDDRERAESSCVVACRHACKTPTRVSANLHVLVVTLAQMPTRVGICE